LNITQSRNLTSSDLLPNDLISSELCGGAVIGQSHGELQGRVHSEAAQFAVAVTIRSALSSDETRSFVMRSDEVR